MTVYHYRAKNGPEAIVEGTVEALSEKEAIEKVNAQGLIPLQIEEHRELRRQVPSPERSSFGAAVGSRQITIFSRQLASLLKAGVPILRCLSIIREQSDDRTFRLMVQNIHKKVEDGTQFSAVLSEYPRIFSPLYIAMVRAGEDSGQMPDVLLKISDYRVKQEEMIGRIRMAMAYPVLMALVGVGTVIFMFTMVMPRLMRIYNDMGQNLPLSTKLLLAITRGLRESWPMILIILAAAALAGLQASRTKAGRTFISLFKLRLPVFGPFLVKAELARFARTLELLLRSGIPILRALGIAIPVVSNEIIKDKLTRSYRQLEQGGTLGRSLRETTVVPVFMSNLISVGEESGKLIDSLSELASAYERDTDESIRILGSLLEPVMILIMGLIVGFIVMAMLLPIFQINVMVR